MNKILVLVLLSIAPLFAHAITTLRFLPMNRNSLALILEKDITGNTDDDFKKLYALLNLPEEDTPLGKVKGIKTSNKGFNLACSLGRTQCQVVLNQSPNTTMDPAQQYMSYKTTGEEAEFLSAAFFKESNGDVFYMTTDRMFRIRGTSNEFVFEASQKGF